MIKVIVMKYEQEFLDYINPIITNDEFIKRKDYMHHINLSVYDHSMQVAYKSYLFAKKHKLDVKSITIGALLHDFYYKPWQENKTKKKFREIEAVKALFYEKGHAAGTRDALLDYVWNVQVNYQLG